jgi:hypothetical protein
VWITPVYITMRRVNQCQCRNFHSFPRDQYIKGEQVHVVLVWKLDRLSRDQNHMTLLAYEMAQHGVRLESVTENFDDSPIGILIRQVYSWASSLERTEIIERTKMGQHNRSDQGLLFGGGRGNYGWDWADEGDLKNARQVVSPKTASIVRRIYIWYVKYSLLPRDCQTPQREGHPCAGRWAVASPRCRSHPSQSPVQRRSIQQKGEPHLTNLRISSNICLLCEQRTHGCSAREK